MATEIERKFLVKNNSWEKSVKKKLRIQQFYLSDGNNTVRVRIINDKDAKMTIKGPTQGISRPEYEFDIPLKDAKEMKKLKVSDIIDKTRHIVEFNGHIWEVDTFYGANTGLTIAEIELENKKQGFPIPNWLGSEVTKEKKFTNYNLSKKPVNKR
jgi:adenylate cyclase